jgi:hypothetical protein
MTADKLVEDNTLSTHNIGVFIGGSELRTNSIFVKVGERSRFILWAGASSYMFDLINLTTTPGNNSSLITSTKIESYGNGWYTFKDVDSRPIEPLTVYFVRNDGRIDSTFQCP